MNHFFASAMISLLGFACLLGAAPAAGEPGGLPPGEKEAKDILNKSPRHGEFVDVTAPDTKAPFRAYIVYPERKEKAPVVIVIQEIFGLSDWLRGVTDQLAADGFIAIAPDLLSGHGKDGGGTDSFANRDDVVKAVRSLPQDEVAARLEAVRAYGLKLPAASGKSASVGFCWGGGQSFAFASLQPELDAAVVYYGVPPTEAAMEKIKSPVLGLYGGNDARITSTVDPTSVTMKRFQKKYSPHIFDGAGHGFLRAQDGQNGANYKAAQNAWPMTIKFLRERTESTAGSTQPSAK